MSRKWKSISLMSALALLVSLFASATAFAEGIEGTEIHLISEDSGYKIVVPNFIEQKKVKTIDANEELVEANVVVMETPQKDSDGSYPIFEVVTSDQCAASIESYPGVLGYGQAGSGDGMFQDGRAMYRFSGGDLDEGTVYSLDFSVADKDANECFSVGDLNVMFVNKDQTGNAAEVVSATPTASKVLVNGKEVSFEAYNIEGNNYFKLRDFAAAVNGTEKQFEVGWDSEKNAITLESGKAYTPNGGELAVSANKAAKDAKRTNSQIYVDGTEVLLTAYNIDGNNYFKLRELAIVFNIGVTWDEASNSIGIQTASNYNEQVE